MKTFIYQHTTKIIGTLFLCLAGLCVISCESAEEISRSFDMEVPTCIVLNDSMAVQAGTSTQIEVQISDNAGLSRVELSYGEWFINEATDLSANKPLSYTYTAKIDIPADAEKEWDEVVYRNDGSSYTIHQVYHQIQLLAYDINQNKRKTIIYLQVK